MRRTLLTQLLTNIINETDLPGILYVHLFVKFKDRSFSEAVDSLVS